MTLFGGNGRNVQIFHVSAINKILAVTYAFRHSEQRVNGHFPCDLPKHPTLNLINYAILLIKEIILFIGLDLDKDNAYLGITLLDLDKCTEQAV